MRRLFTLMLRFLLYATLLAGLLSAIILAAVPVARMYLPENLPEADNSQAIAIDDVNIISMVGNEVLKKRQVLIEQGLILDIVPAGSRVDPRFQVIDANGGWLLPGLFDMHVHVYDRKYQVLSLAYGVTSVRNMAGFPFHLRWQQELENGEWLGSRLLSSSPVINDPAYADPLSHVAVDDPQQARNLVRRYKQEGWSSVKIYEGLAANVYEAIVDEARLQDIPVVGHLPYSIVEKDYRLAAAMHSLEHAEEIYDGPLDYEFDYERLAATVHHLEDMSATITPTLMIFDHLTRLAAEKQNYLEQQPLYYLNPLVRFIMDRTDGRRWLQAGEEVIEHNLRQNAFLRDIVHMLDRNRVNMVLGSDSGVIYAAQGIASHDEMALMVEAGLSPWAVLRTATSNAARAAGLDDRLGSIEVGKTADLVLVWDNPLFDVRVLREPRAVVKNGQYLNREEILELRLSAREQSNPYVTLGHLLEFQFYR